MKRIFPLLLAGFLPILLPISTLRAEPPKEELPPLLIDPAREYAEKEKALDEEQSKLSETARTAYLDTLNAAIAKIEKGNNLAESEPIRTEVKRFQKPGNDGPPSDKAPNVVKAAYKIYQKEAERVAGVMLPKRNALHTGYLRILGEIEKSYAAQNDEFAIAIIRRARGVVTRRMAVDTDQVVIVGTEPKNAVVKDMAPDGGYLIGFETGNGPWVGGVQVVGGLKAIYSTEAGEKEGPVHGLYPGSTRTVAKEGYAVGGIVLRTREASGIPSFVVACFQVVFMKIKPDGQNLDPNDSYRTDWIGGEGNAKVKEADCHGKMVVGLRIKPGEIIDNICLVSMR